MAASTGAGDDGGAPFIDSSRLDLRRYARRPALAMVLADYLVYVERNPRKTLDLAAESTSLKEFKDWWWKARLGKCYYKLGAPDISYENAWSVLLVQFCLCFSQVSTDGREGCRVCGCTNDCICREILIVGRRIWCRSGGVARHDGYE